MARRTNTAQLAFDWDATPAVIATPVPPTVSLADRLIEAGLIPNLFLLDLNRCLTVPSDMRSSFPWSLPSRAFQFPVRVHRPIYDWDPPECLFLLSEAMREHPFVRHVAEIMGDMPEVRFEDGWRGHYNGWHHAVDLMTDLHFEDLLITRRFSSTESIACAVVIGVEFGSLDVGNARKVMHGMGWPEPQGRSDDLLMGEGIWPGRVKREWSINPRGRDPAAAWMMIHGCEDRWFVADRKGCLNMATEGLRRRGIAVEDPKPRSPKPKRKTVIDKAA